MDAVFGGWSVHIEYQLQHWGYAITFYRHRENGFTDILEFPTGPCLVHSVRDGEYRPDAKPTLLMDEGTCMELVSVMMKQGVKPKDTSKTEGVLESQTKHLEDLRNILKKQRVMS
jgi:hypothetical protein